MKERRRWKVAEQINISQAQVSRLEKNALKIMRKYLLGNKSAKKQYVRRKNRLFKSILSDKVTDGNINLTKDKRGLKNGVQSMYI